ncbi:hypothetical protein BGCPKDLD_5210 [Methylorubrum suomiense]|uniref:Uncharacterized protein n=1 Tax=Methylorubrum suomiense TaxID=144191 RepID=A0ABQ4V531_9HYPH|nr:hypothetical protein BGCPKDLD_5210 [Methylorubrum suomiense]
MGEVGKDVRDVVGMSERLPLGLDVNLGLAFRQPVLAGALRGEQHASRRDLVVPGAGLGGLHLRLVAVALAQVEGDAEEAEFQPVLGAQEADVEQNRQTVAALGDVGPLAGIGLAAPGLGNEHFEARLDGSSQFAREDTGPALNLGRIMERGWGRLTHQLVGGVTQHPLGGRVEQGDGPMHVGGDDRVAGVGKDGPLQG